MLHPVLIEVIPEGILAGIRVVQIDTVEALGNDPVDGGSIVSGRYVGIPTSSVDDDVLPVRSPPLYDSLFGIVITVVKCQP